MGLQGIDQDFQNHFRYIGSRSTFQSMGTTWTSEDLRMFHPRRTKAFDHRVVLAFLNYFFRDISTAQVIDPQDLHKAHKLGTTLMIDPPTQIIIAPLEHEQHWALLIFGLCAEVCHVYTLDNHTEHTETIAVRYTIKKTLSSNLIYEQHPVAVQASDRGCHEHSCGVDILDYAEAFALGLETDAPAPKSLSQARIKYLNLLIQPLIAENDLRQLGAVLPNSQRKTTKQRRLTFLNNASNKETSFENKLYELGENWLQFYLTENKNRHLDAKRVLALAQGIGCPRFVTDLAEIVRIRRIQPEPWNWTQAAVDLYEKGQVMSVSAVVQRRCTFLYLASRAQETEKSDE